MSLYYNIPEKHQKKFIYRIISKERLFQLFDNNQNVLVHPSCWDDPYENFILKSKLRLNTGEIRDFDYHENFYGQCWSRHKASDAMWRIYSPNRDGIRIRTTTNKLLESLYFGGSDKPSWSCIIGKVQYLPEKKLKKFANSIYVNGGLTKENIFQSLLVKRLAFKHENEVRLLYFDLNKKVKGNLFPYSMDPHSLISQIMIDPRFTYKEYEKLKNEIVKRTGYSGQIKRSLLYAAPEEIVLNDNPA